MRHKSYPNWIMSTVEAVLWRDLVTLTYGGGAVVATVKGDALSRVRSE